jgi:hypothetical protein
MEKLKALWFRVSKSATVWLAAGLASAPDILTYMQGNFPSISPYLPHLLQDQGMKWIALAVFVARMRSMIRVP